MEIKTINPIILNGKCVANENSQSNNDSETGISEFSYFDFGNPFTQSTPLNNLSKPKPGKYFAKNPLSSNPYLNGTYKPRNNPGTTNYITPNSLEIKKPTYIPKNEDLQPEAVSEPIKMNWWKKQTKKNKIMIASVGLITVAAVIYFMTKKKK